MKKIKEYVEHIEDEICSAKDYAEKYVEYKAKGDATWANRFHTMASEELEHAEYIHELALKDIEELSKVFTPPQDMQEKWDKAHAYYVEKVAWIKQMLSM